MFSIRETTARNIQTRCKPNTTVLNLTPRIFLDISVVLNLLQYNMT